MFFLQRFLLWSRSALQAAWAWGYHYQCMRCDTQAVGVRALDPIRATHQHCKFNTIHDCLAWVDFFLFYFILFLFLCMCVDAIPMCLYLHVCAYIHMSTEDDGLSAQLLSTFFLSSLVRQGLSLAWNVPNWQVWLAARLALHWAIASAPRPD